MLTRTLIATSVWAMSFDSNTNAVDLAVRRLRANVDDGLAKVLVGHPCLPAAVRGPHESILFATHGDDQPDPRSPARRRRGTRGRPGNWSGDPDIPL